jgi:hypothetical protein
MCPPPLCRIWRAASCDTQKNPARFVETTRPKSSVVYSVKGFGTEDARIVDHDIHLSESLYCSFDQAARGGRIAYVAVNQHQVVRRGQRFRARYVPRVRKYSEARCEESPRQAETNAAGGSGDNCRLFVVHGSIDEPARRRIRHSRRRAAESGYRLVSWFGG